MKLIYIDPGCSGLQIQDCKTLKEIERVLAQQGFDEKNCTEVIYYVFVDSKGKLTMGSLDFT